MTTPPPNGYPEPPHGFGHDPAQQHQQPAPGPYNQMPPAGPSHRAAPEGPYPTPAPSGQAPSGQTTPGQSGQSPYGQPGQSPYGQSGQSPYGHTPSGQPSYGQTPYSQPPYGQSPYGQSPYGPSENPGPYGQPAPYGPPPQKPKSSVPIIVGIVALVVLIVAAAAALIAVSGDSDDPVAAPSPSSSSATSTAPTTPSKPGGETIRSTQVGSCITVTGSLTDIKTKGASCEDASPPSYIVGAKLASKDACEAAGYYSYVYEYGIGASRDYLCLVPNWQVGTCYEQSTLDVELKTVACSRTSSPTVTRLKVTERTGSKRVPNCTGSESLKVFAFDIQSSPARQVGFCAEILGDYVWE